MREEETTQFEVFRDCLSTPLIDTFNVDSQKKSKKRKAKSKDVVTRGDAHVHNVSQSDEADPETLGEFVDYTAEEIFMCLPLELRTMTFSEYTNSESLQARYQPPLTLSDTETVLSSVSPDIAESLLSYGVISDASDLDNFLLPVLNAYLASTTRAPPPPSQTKDLASGCEICERDWIPLTYHHLIPKMVHAKALKRGWHTEDQLNNVAWLCRACHTFVHRIAGHEELAKELYTIDRLLERDDVQRYAQWVGKVRWKAR